MIDYKQTRELLYNLIKAFSLKPGGGVSHAGQIPVKKLVSQQGKKPFVETYYKKPKQDSYRQLLDKVDDLVEKFRGWVSSLTREETNAVSWYTNFGYFTANKYLRGLAKESAQTEMVKPQINYLTSALNKSKLTEPITVHRKIRGTELINHFKQLKANGGLFEEKAFMSTTVVPNSFNPSDSKGLINMVIDVPAGEGSGAFVKSLSKHSDEQEFLLNRGSLFEIGDITTNRPISIGAPQYTVHLKLVGRSADSNEKV